MGIRGILPYVPARVLRQFGRRQNVPARVLRQLGRRQNVPQVGNMGQYVIDHEEGRVPYAKDITIECESATILKRDTLAKDRFNTRCDEAYKAWLKEELQGTLVPGPNIYDRVGVGESKLKYNYDRYRKK
ncbi:hypothetical protein HAX54_013047 [Datura stramonium]|uniref:Uncharacterized protein n=1 Tax=Datura stramonium TaxID=4076 RepID=A0ABS8TMA1_DATST|nr:hypothetical protein [Datura stramonium]